jgi:site-specific DNA-methyltransferase (adenine-specific)
MSKDLLIHGDCFDVINQMANNSVNAVITDPPYNTTKCKFDLEKFDPQKFFSEINRICKPDGNIIVFSQQPFTSELIAANKKYFRHEIIWEKNMALGFLNAKKRPLRAHENILIFSQKGYGTYNPEKTRVHNKTKTKKTRGICQHYNQAKVDFIDDGTRYPRSVVKYQNVSKAWDKNAFHPTQKPLSLISWLMLNFTNPEDLIFDPFGGSATTAVAAIETGRKYIVIEKDLDFFNKALKRIELTDPLLNRSC